MGSRKLKPLKLEKNDGTGKWRKAIVFENWENDLRDIWKVGDLDPESEDAMSWLGCQLEEDAKILYASFR